MRVEYKQMASRLQEMEARLKASESIVGSEGSSLMPPTHNTMMGSGTANTGRRSSSFSSMDSVDGSTRYSFDEEDLEDEEAGAIRATRLVFPMLESCSPVYLSV